MPERCPERVGNYLFLCKLYAKNHNKFMPEQ